MQTVIIGHNPLEPETWTKHEVQDIRELLLEQFSVWPDHARIYHGEVAEDRDVTPHNEAEIERLGELEGVFFVINYPGDLITAIIAVVAVIATAAVAFLFMPSMPQLKNTQTQSPNNALSDRSNQARPLGRIPDIFGTVRSTPDLLMVPYKIFDNHQELEVAYMCVGKGEFAIDDIRDDTTPIEQIAGTSVEVYGPGTSPKSGDDPIVAIGSPITHPLVNAKRYSSVNGQVLEAPSGAQSYFGQCKYVYPNKIVAEPTTTSPGSEISGPIEVPTDLTAYFSAGDTITVTAPTTGDLITVNLSGTYQINSVTATEIVLVNPAATNSDWNDLDDFAGNDTDFINTSLISSGNKWIGPFLLSVNDLTMVLGNFVALNGLYKDDGENQFPVNIQVEIELTPVNPSGVPIGAAELFTATVFGATNDRSTRAVTMYAEPTFTGPCLVRGRRVTPKDTEFKGTVVDEVKWRDVYSVAPVEQDDFGNVTTVFSTTYATEGALALKDRKLNMLVTRKLPLRMLGSTYTTELYPTRFAGDILVAMALDPYIGNRTINELDIDNIYNSLADVQTYFGTQLASEFCYTFDKDNISFEESVQSVAGAVFCQAYRRGSIISLFFEKATEDSSLLFNHRNKLPGTETRTVTFGRTNDYDGVEFRYVDPYDDATVSYYIPEDRSAVNPKKIESIGVRGFVQAYFAAWRAWQKIVYQNTTVEFEATQEADLLIVQERVRVADNTRADTQDGQIEEQSGLTVTLSQPFKADNGVSYTMFLQHVDKSLQSIPITATANPYQVLLGAPPTSALSLDPENFAVATYQIVGNNSPRDSAFLITEKTPKSNFTVTLKAINYDARYYSKDKDFINGIIS